MPKNSQRNPVKDLAVCLTDGYQHRPEEMLRFFLSRLMGMWGMTEWAGVPDSAQSRVDDAIAAYDRAIAAEEPFQDILGPLYMDLASHGGRQALGQFFTPWPVAQLMAAMTITNVPEKPDGDLLRTIDPACGSGVMMLAAANGILNSMGPGALRRWSFTGVDLDPYCARLMTSQFIANCAVHRVHVGELIVFRGDSLRPTLDSLELIVHATAPAAAAVPAKHPARIEAIRAAAQSSQYELFEAA